MFTSFEPPDKPLIFSGNNYLEGEEIKRFVLDLMHRAGHTLSEDQVDHCITVNKNLS